MTRRATIRTAHADPEVVAAALAPDNTDEMDTRVESVADGDESAGDGTDDGADDEERRVVVTEIERESTSGLQSTIDDTLVNLAVADEVATHARSGDDGQTRSGDAAHARSENATTPSDDDTRPTDDTRTTEDAQTTNRQQTDTNDTS